MSDNDKRRDAATALRAAVLAGLTEFEVIEGNDRSFWVHLRSDTDKRGAMVAEVSIDANDRRDFSGVVSATVRPDWGLRRSSFGAPAKAVTFWAGWKKDFVIDPAKVLARVRRLAEAKRVNDAAEAEHRKWRAAHNAKVAAVRAPVEAFMAEKGIEPGWTNTTRVREWSASESGRFAIKLDGLSEADMLAVLAVVATK